MEWEILGDLGLRLSHKEEAKEAYQRCLDSMRFSPKPWLKLLEMYSDEGDLQRSLQAAIRVAAYQYVDYGEMAVSFPKPLIAVDIQFILNVTVPYDNRPMLLQIESNSRARKDFVHPNEHGAS